MKQWVIVLLLLVTAVLWGGVEEDLAGCDKHYKNACVAAADHYLNSETLNIKKGVSLLKTACRYRSGAACTRLGVFYRDGNHVRKNQKTAKKLFKKGCKLKDQQGCDYLNPPKNSGTVVIERGSGGDVVIEGGNSGGNTHGNVVVIEHGNSNDNDGNNGNSGSSGVIVVDGNNHNDSGNSVVVVEGGDDTPEATDEGTDVKEDVAPEAKPNLTALRKQCRNKVAMACFKLGDIHEQGCWIKSSRKMMRAYFKLACKGGVKEGCKRLKSKIKPVMRTCGNHKVFNEKKRVQKPVRYRKR